jgi:acyl transferase domain-containing protein/acyl-CoA synthetase (AMP-forming)/AMP-acid ligase II/acyl carrier protein/SAM-dependent methyltransferase
MKAGSLTTFVDVLRQRAAEGSDVVAYTFLCDGEDREISLTYGQLDLWARMIAARLRAFGAEQTRVLIVYPPGLEFICAFFGCLYAGAIAVPAYPPDPARVSRTLPRLQAIARDASAGIVLTTTAMLAMAEPLVVHAPDLRRLRWLATDDCPPDEAAGWRPPAIDGATLALLQYTSGSTGSPKGVMLSHANLLHNEQLIRTAFRFDAARDRVASWLPVYHDMGLIGTMLQPPFCGVPSILMSPVDFLKRPLRWLRAISRHRATVSGGPNFAYDLCVRKIRDDERPDLDLSCWELAFSGAEPVRADTIDRFVSTFAPYGFRREAFYPCYGLAEAALMVSGGVRDAGPMVRAFARAPLELEGRAVPVEDGHGPCAVAMLVGCGGPLLDERVVIVDPEALTRCASGRVGEIWVESGSVAQGYWERPDETETSFRGRLADTDDGPFLRTGDMGFIADGELFVTGRRKDVMIVRGRNIHPADVELTVGTAHSALRRGCGAAFSVETSGEECVVVVQEVDTRAEWNADDIFAAIRGRLSEEHDVQPAAVVLLAPGTIPKTSSGKIQRGACRAAYLAETLDVVRHSPRMNRTVAVGGDGGVVPDRCETAALESWLIEWLLSCLGADSQIDTKTPFAQYGLDSIQALGLIGDLERKLGRSLPATLIWNYPTVERLAHHLTGEHGAGMERRSAVHDNPIAVIGIGCRFPMADGPEAFWRLLRDGVDAVADAAPTRRMVSEGVALPRCAYLRDVSGFDAGFFGISPREATRIDPQQRLLLEVAWEALENAGQAPDALAGSATGVFVGISSNDYYVLQARDREPSDVYDPTGNSHAIAANRISYFLDLRGPSLAVDTACSSSLVAVHLACENLRRGDCDLALAGGVNLLLDSDLTANLDQAGLMARDSRCKTFDAAADGYVRGEGAGVVVLKRLADALEDGDRIVALVRGSAISQDGRSNGLTAPNGLAQEAVIRQALSNAEVDPTTVTYVEAHGTGTPLGDPIEVEALGSVYGRERPGTLCALGSVKTNIGHLEAAAGIAGLIKVALALAHEEIPPHLHLRELNPRLAATGRCFLIPTQRVPWLRSEEPRRASVSSFGFGGTNAHVVLEEAPHDDRAGRPADHPVHLLALSAATEPALRALSERFITYLETHPAAALADVCFTANTGRSQSVHRLAVCARSSTEMCEQLLRSVGRATGPGVLGRDGQLQCRANVAFVFGAYEAEGTNRGRQLYATERIFRDAINSCVEMTRLPLREALWANAPNEKKNPSLAVPAHFALAYALARLWNTWGVAPVALCGYGIGECVAAVAAGMLAIDDALRFAMALGRTLDVPPDGGSSNAAAIDLLEDAAARLRVSPPRIPMISTVTGDAVDPARIGPAHWLNVGRTPARLDDAFECLWRMGCRFFVEVAARPTPLRKAIAERTAAVVVPCLSSEDDLAGLSELYVHGVTVDWKQFEQGRGGRNIALPSYPFQRQRYWFSARSAMRPAASLDPPPLRPLDDEEGPADGTTVFQEHLARARDVMVREHRIGGVPTFPAAGFLEMALGAGRYHAKRPVSTLRNVKLPSLLRFGVEAETTVRVSLRPIQAVERTMAFEIRSSGVSIPEPDPYRLEISHPGVLADLCLCPTRRRQPEPAAVEIEVRAAGLNFVDVLRALAVHTEDPIRLGAECAGIVSAVGSGVENLSVGDEVVAIAPHSFATFAVTDARLVARKPRNMTFADAATVPIAFLTAHLALIECGRLQSGERILVHSAAGGVGLAAIAIARSKGAEIFATVGNAEKRAFLKAQGIEHVMDSRALSFADEVMEKTEGKGVDLILNSLPGEAIARGLMALAPYGRFVETGKSDIFRDTQIGLAPFRKNLSFFAIDLERMCQERPDRIGVLLRELLQSFEDGTLAPLPHTVFSVEDASSGFRHMAARRNIGKVVLAVGNGNRPGADESRASLHATGEIALRPRADSPLRVDLSAIRARCHRQISDAELHETLKHLGAERGPYYRSIEQLWTDGQELLASLRLTKSARQDCGKTAGESLHPALLDGALQTLVTLLPADATNDQDGAYVPVAFDEVHVSAALPSRLFAYAMREPGGVRGSDEVLRADILLADSDGLVIASLRGVSVRRMPLQPRSVAEDEVIAPSRPLIPGLPEPPVDRWFHRVNWIATPRTAERRILKGPWLVLIDERGLADLVIERLCSRGATVVKLARGRNFFRRNAREYCINVARREDYRLLARHLAEEGLAPAGILHCWALDLPANPGSLAELEESLEAGVLSLFHLTQALTGLFRGEMAFYMISADSQATDRETDRSVAPAISALWGFAHVIPQEYPRVRSTTIDLEARNASLDRLADAVLAELEVAPDDADRTGSVVYRDGVRLVPHIAPLNLSEMPSHVLPLRRGGVYLITGGQCGLGLEIARFLATRVHARLALLNRTVLGDDIHPERAQAVADLEQLGAEVLPLAGDVADLAAMREHLATIRARWGRLDGVIHAAGVLRDGLIATISLDAFHEVLRPKVHGTWVLDRVTQAEDLDFFVLCSSLASLFAPAGQSSHVVANSFEDAFAHQRARTRGQRTLAVNWGPWRETGVVASPVYLKRFEQQGLHAMSTRDGIAAFERALCLPMSQVAIFARTPPAQAPASEPIRKSIGAAAIAERVRATIDPGQGLHVGPQFQALEIDLAALCGACASWALRQLGWAPDRDEQSGYEPLADSLGIAPRHRRLFARLRQLACATDSHDVGQPSIASFMDRYPDWCGAFTLLERCTSALPDVLRGMRSPTEVLFPDGSLAALEALYERSPLPLFFNQLAASAVAAAVADRSSHGPVRVLELGAGTGGTTAHVLPRLATTSVDYVFTDVSPLFLRKAQKKFEHFEFVQYRSLDIEQEPQTHGFAPHSFDIIIAAHVLHATADLRRSLGHISTLLRPGGLLVLIEPVEDRPWMDLIFGLTEGWWKYRDVDLRKDSRLLSAGAWRELLHDLEFIEPVTIPGDGDCTSAAPQALILATAPEVVVEWQDQPAPDGSSAALGAKSIADGRDEAMREPGSCAPAWLTSAIRNQVALALRVAPDEVHLGDSFEQLGVDSLLGTELVAVLGKELGIKLAPTLLFDHPSIEELSRHLARELEAQLAGSARADLRSPAASSVEQVPATPKSGFDPPRTSNGVRIEPASAGDMAVIGMACRLPGAPNLDAYWELLQRGGDAIEEIPRDRWDWRQYFDPNVDAQDKSYCRWGGFLDEVDRFDPRFFHITPREARVMDPQQRIFLETAWRALEHAGYAGRALAGTDTGVFVGCSRNDYLRLVAPVLGKTDGRAAFGNNNAIIPNRLSFLLNLRGPSALVDTLCSSSLVALHLGCQAVRAGECRVAIVGAVNVLLSPEYYVALSRLRVHSPDGRCKPFDHRANGFVSSEGVVVVLIKQLAEAIADGDRVHAVIKGTAVNHDGRTNGLAAPSARAQAEVVRRALERAAVHPSSITYVETHGTGTSLGDPIEIDGLTRAFQPLSDRKRPCRIGSAKTNVGHTEAVAGFAGLVKVILAMQQGLIPASLHFERANSLIAFDQTPFVVNTELSPWISDGPKRAGVSSFGLGGTNAHVVVEEAPPVRPGTVEMPPYLFVVSARSQAAFHTLCCRYREYLAAGRYGSLRDLCYTAIAGAAHFRYRAAIEARSLDELHTKLGLLELPDDAVELDGAGVFRGVAIEDALATSSDRAHSADGAVASGDLAEVAVRFVRGAAIEWTHPVGDGRPCRVSLAPYPFDRMRCWVDSAGNGTDRERTHRAENDQCSQEEIHDSDAAGNQAFPNR